jgi:hypothetical protein
VWSTLQFTLQPDHLLNQTLAHVFLLRAALGELVILRRRRRIPQFLEGSVLDDYRLRSIGSNVDERIAVVRRNVMKGYINGGAVLVRLESAFDGERLVEPTRRAL